TAVVVLVIRLRIAPAAGQTGGGTLFAKSVQGGYPPYSGASRGGAMLTQGGPEMARKQSAKKKRQAPSEAIPPGATTKALDRTSRPGAPPPSKPRDQHEAGTPA